MKRKKIILLISLIGILIIILGINQFITLRKAHSTFDNYYVFRGCVRLLDRNDEFGICETNAGQTIKIVKFQNRWYLDGDLPVCLFKSCF